MYNIMVVIVKMTFIMMPLQVPFPLLIIVPIRVAESVPSASENKLWR